MNFLDKVIKPVMKRIVKNRWNYTDEELGKAAESGLFDTLNLKDMGYWIVAHPVCSKHCSGGNYEGRPLYFNPMGNLIRHKCPPGICIHGLSQLSPIIYNYVDHLLQGKDPSNMIFNYTTCTDVGLKAGGLGSNLFRVSYEKMPFIEFLRFVLTMTPYLFRRNKRARGECSDVKKAPISGGPKPSEFMNKLPLESNELESFLASPGRVKRLQAAEKYRDHSIIVKVISSNACIAGHKQGDEFLIDSIGVVQPPADGRGICIMALNKIWWRVMLMLERMAGAGETGGEFKGKLFDLPMNCYGAGLPLGACGEILMTIEVRKST